MNFLWCITVVLMAVVVCISYRQVDAQETLEEKMRADPDISEFLSKLEQCQVCNSTIEYEHLTIFAPVNQAFQKVDPKELQDPVSLVQYHLSSQPKRTEQFGGSYTSMNTRLTGNPPLWITHTRGTYHNDIYINNAKLMISQSNVMGKKKGNIIQILHKIDQVLIPTRPNDNNIFNPTAWEFLENYKSFIQGPHRVRSFYERVVQNHKEGIFKNEGGHTFFIPVDEGFGNSRAALIDDKVIDGHVIPTQVLFTTPTKKDVPFQTLANNNLRVVVSFTQEKRGKDGEIIINYIKSNTVLSDAKHTQGSVLAEIVKPNIPVKNGVIHLISKPLMIVDSTVRELLQEKDGGILSSFVNAINGANAAGQDFLNIIERAHDVTLFAPCNKAFDDDMRIKGILNNNQKLIEILKLHVVVDNKLYEEKVFNELRNREVYQVPTLAIGQNMYFNVVNIGNHRNMTVEAGGVNATVIQADLAAKNGIIHVIDRVLGIPYNTIEHKIRNDRLLSDTYFLGSFNFNERLNDTSKILTYFVPRNKAWRDMNTIMPSIIKKLFMPEYINYYGVQTLERHLIVSEDSPYTMERIKQMTSQRNNGYNNETRRFECKSPVELVAVRGVLKVCVEEIYGNATTPSYQLGRKPNSTFIIHWNGLMIPVFRPNVECTNGVIHVIDAPFLQKGDIRIGGSAIFIASPILILLTAVLSFIIPA